MVWVEIMESEQVVLKVETYESELQEAILHDFSLKTGGCIYNERRAGLLNCL